MWAFLPTINTAKFKNMSINTTGKKKNICTFFQDKILNRAALVGIPPVLGSIFNEVAGWKSTFIKKK